MESGARKSKRGRTQKPTARFSPVLGNSSYAGEWITTTVRKKRGQVSVHPPPSSPIDLGGTQGVTTSCSSKTLEGPDVVSSLPGEGVNKVDNAAVVVAPAGVTVEIPSFRRVTREELFPEGVEEQGPRDDMSDEAFARRHRKLELEEKRIKRWDLRAQRRESYKENLQRNEKERMRKKELKRQPRKRKGAQPKPVEPEPSDFTHRMEEVLAIQVCQEEELPPPPSNFSLEKVPE